MTADPQEFVPATVHLAFDVTVADFEDFYLYLDDFGGKRAKRRRLFAMTFLVFAAFLPLYHYVLGNGLHVANLPVMYGGPIGFLAALIIGSEVLRPWLLRRRIHWTFGRVPRDPIFGRKRFEANHEGLTVTAKWVTTHFAWAAIVSVKETLAHFFLMTSDAGGIIIPKRGQPQAALAALRRVAAAYTGGRRSAG